MQASTRQELEHLSLVVFLCSSLTAVLDFELAEEAEKVLGRSGQNTLQWMDGRCYWPFGIGQNPSLGCRTPAHDKVLI